MKNPCDPNCPKRRAACHSVCPLYQEYRAYLDEKNKSIRQYNAIYGYKKAKNDRIERRMRRIKKRGDF